MTRPTFAECYEYARASSYSWKTPPAVVDEITSILRTLAAGSDPRTCRVGEDGRQRPWRAK